MRSLGHGAPQASSRIGRNHDQERRNTMQVKIESCTKDLRPLRGSQDQQTIDTGLKLGGQWYNLRGDHRNLYNKVVDLELNGKLAKFATPQIPPAPAQKPPPPPPPTNGHMPRWATREDAVDTYIFY